MQERKPEVKLLPHQRTIKDVEGNLAKAYCEVHEEEMYFERVEGDLFQCAWIDHKGNISKVSLTNRPPDCIDI